MNRAIWARCGEHTPHDGLLLDYQTIAEELEAKHPGLGDQNGEVDPETIVRFVLSKVFA